MAKKARFLSVKNAASAIALAKAVGKISRAANAKAAADDDMKELKKLMNDPATWLDGFAKIDDGTPKGKKIKGNLRIIPVFDSEDVMFVKIPNVNDLPNLAGPAPPENYANYGEFLAKYFIRKCR